eukprot:scaffold576_cov260-Pinguiococcus_pyrenoidosus.AAC.103
MRDIGITLISLTPVASESSFTMPFFPRDGSDCSASKAARVTVRLLRTCVRGRQRQLQRTDANEQASLALVRPRDEQHGISGLGRLCARRHKDQVLIRDALVELFSRHDGIVLLVQIARLEVSVEANANLRERSLRFADIPRVHWRFFLAKFSVRLLPGRAVSSWVRHKRILPARFRRSTAPKKRPTSYRRANRVWVSMALSLGNAVSVYCKDQVMSIHNRDERTELNWISADEGPVFFEDVALQVVQNSRDPPNFLASPTAARLEVEGCSALLAQPQTAGKSGNPAEETAAGARNGHLQRRHRRTRATDAHEKRASRGHKAEQQHSSHDGVNYAATTCGEGGFFASLRAQELLHETVRRLTTASSSLAGRPHSTTFSACGLSWPRTESGLRFVRLARPAHQIAHHAQHPRRSIQHVRHQTVGS